MPQHHDGGVPITSFFYMNCATDIEDLDFSDMDVEAALSWAILPTVTRKKEREDSAPSPEDSIKVC